MQLFRKKPFPPAGEDPEQQNRQARAIARVIACRQQRLAQFLSGRFEKLPLHARKACFLCFCILMGSACSVIILQTFRSTASHQLRSAIPGETGPSNGMTGNTRKGLSIPNLPQHREHPDSLPATERSPSFILK